MHNLHSLPLLNHTLEYSLEKLRQKVYLSLLMVANTMTSYLDLSQLSSKTP